MNIPQLNFNSNLHEGLNALEESTAGIFFVIDEDLRLVGVVTDGDLRRYLLSGGQMSASVSTIMQTKYVSLQLGASLVQVQDAVAKYGVVPILDLDSHVVDVATKSKFHHVPLIEPVLNGNELEYVTDCIQSGWISSQGTYVRKFEEMFAAYVNSKNAISVSNGTVAIHLALEALGIGPGDEVLVPNLTFASSVNAIIHAGAIPVLVDIEIDTLGIDISRAEELLTSSTKAIIVVHLYGQAAKMDQIMEFATKNNLLVIEDCAEAIGTKFNGNHVGTFGNAATFSFFGNKTLTTGEGGMVLFSSLEISNKARILRDHGMSPQRKYWHEVVGYNYRLTNLQAALGVAQLEQVEELVGGKRNLANVYQHDLSTVDELTVASDTYESVNSFWLFTVLLNKEHIWKRDQILSALSNMGVEARPFFIPIHEMPPYGDFRRNKDLSVSEIVSKSGICLPSSPNLSEEQIHHVTSSLIRALRELAR